MESNAAKQISPHFFSGWLKAMLALLVLRACFFAYLTFEVVDAYSGLAGLFELIRSSEFFAAPFATKLLIVIEVLYFPALFVYEIFLIYLFVRGRRTLLHALLFAPLVVFTLFASKAGLMLFLQIPTEGLSSSGGTGLIILLGIYQYVCTNKTARAVFAN
jgi:hypothetical protein